MSKGDIKQVIVLGCPRSGTSIVAGILHYLGVYMGDTLREGDQFNKNGYFEDIDFMQANDELMEQGGVTNWDLFPMYPHKYNLEKIRNLVLRRNALHNIWGVKAGMNKTIPYIHQEFPNPYFIICKRHLLNISQSIQKRKGFTSKLAYEIAGFYSNIIENFQYFLDVYDYPYIMIEYDYSAKGKTDAIADFLDIQPIKEQYERIEEFIY